MVTEKPNFKERNKDKIEAKKKNNPYTNTHKTITFLRKIHVCYPIPNISFRLTNKPASL